MHLVLNKIWTHFLHLSPPVITRDMVYHSPASGRLTRMCMASRDCKKPSRTTPTSFIGYFTSQTKKPHKLLEDFFKLCWLALSHLFFALSLLSLILPTFSPLIFLPLDKPPAPGFPYHYLTLFFPLSPSFTLFPSPLSHAPKHRQQHHSLSPYRNSCLRSQCGISERRAGLGQLRATRCCELMCTPASPTAALLTPSPVNKHLPCPYPIFDSFLAFQLKKPDHSKAASAMYFPAVIGRLAKLNSEVHDLFECFRRPHHVSLFLFRCLPIKGSNLVEK